MGSINTERHRYRYRSSDEVGDLFQNRFPDSKIAGHYRMETNKLFSVKSHGLSPFIRNDLVQDENQCERLFLCFHEQKSHQNMEQLNLLLK